MQNAGASPKVYSVSIHHDNARAAAQEAADELVEGLQAPPDLVLVFFSAEFNAEDVAAGLKTRLPSATSIVGCSSYAEVSQDEAVTRSVTAIGFRLPGIQWKTFSRPSSGWPSFDIGKDIGEELRPLNPELVILFPDVLRENATQILLGLQSALGTHVPVIGGAPGDAGTFTKTYQLCDEIVLSSGVSGVALRGGVHVTTAARSGYTPVGLPRKSTRVEGGNVLLELDGRPALSVYREFLGPRAEEMPAVSIEFPLGVVPAEGADEAFPPLVRAIFRVDEARGALILGGDIPEGGNIRVLRATREGILSGAANATETARASMPDADAALFFNCMSRKVVMGPRYKEECAVSFHALPESLPRAGFYTFGELSPFEGVSVHHESTFTLALIKFEGQTP